MYGREQAGFTIIETMLFLGITGMIMAFMLVGVSSQLNQRRYHDASSSLMSYVEGQYNFVSNVNSSRTADEVCVGNEVKLADGTTPSDGGRGTSDCTVVGRLLRTINDGTGISVTPVVATVDAAILPVNQTDSDIDILHDARLALGLHQEEYATQWNTKLVKPAPDNDTSASFSILIVRMPTNGIIHTYASEDSTATLDDLVAATNLVDFRLCLNPMGLLGAASQPAGVMIKANAANTSGINPVSQGDC